MADDNANIHDEFTKNLREYDQFDLNQDDERKAHEAHYTRLEQVNATYVANQQAMLEALFAKFLPQGEPLLTVDEDVVALDKVRQHIYRTTFVVQALSHHKDSDYNQQRGYLVEFLEEEDRLKAVIAKKKGGKK
jgi:hypothetical protein